MLKCVYFVPSQHNTFRKVLRCRFEAESSNPEIFHGKSEDYPGWDNQSLRQAGIQKLGSECLSRQRDE